MTSSPPQFRAILMSVELTDLPSGFHRLTFKVNRARGQPMTDVAVLISVDAYRRLANQLSRARLPSLDRDRMLKLWAHWELAMRIEDYGVIPTNITITTSNVDDLGAYANGFGRAVLAS